VSLIERPDRGFVFWPVGNGDSTTIILTREATIQVDLHHMLCSEDSDTPTAAVIDELEAILPNRNGKPYLSLFVLTHPDRDHCKGFADLLKRVTIGEIWHAPRIFREYHRDLCDDAKSFRNEIRRRRSLAIEQQGELDSGDRIRVIGWDDLLLDEKYRGFPRHLMTFPGQSVTAFDGEDFSRIFRAFIHGPFKECDQERNDTSVAMQVTLKRGMMEGKVLLLGDYAYENVRQVLDATHDKSNIAWNVFLSPHHCSQKSLYDPAGNLQSDILEKLEAAGLPSGHIIASSRSFPTQNAPGDNPPHIKAKNRYLEILPRGGRFICTQEHPSRQSPQPIVYEVTINGVEYIAPTLTKVDESEKAGLAAVVDRARGAEQPPSTRIGFGCQCGHRK